MAITFRSQSSATTASPNTILNLPKPAGTLTGDVLVAVGIIENGTFAAPSGWTELRSSLATGTAQRMQSWWRVAVNGEALFGYSFNPSSGSAQMAVTIGAYSEARAVVASTSQAGSGSTSIPAPAVTVPADGSLLLAVWHRFDTALSTTGALTLPGGFTQVQAATRYSGHNAIVGASPRNAGSTGPHTATSAQAVPWSAHSLVLAPANTPPNAPTLTAAGALNKDNTNRLSWTPSDPDPGDSQSAYDLRYRVVGAASWTTVSGSTPNAYRDMVAGTFVAADYEWQVRTYDREFVGPWSASGFFTAAAAPAGPAITDPINGQTLSTASYLLTWSSSDQQEYEASVLDADGAVVFTTGTVAEAATRSLLLSFPTNSASRTIRLRTRTAGLWSPYASVTVLISYTTPAVAGVSVLPVSTISSSAGTDAIRVDIANATPSGGQPSVAYHNVFRRAGTTGDGIRIVIDHPAGQAYVDRTPASGVDYSYRVESIAANGTTSTTEWIGDAVDLTPVDPGAGDEGDFADAEFDTADFA